MLQPLDHGALFPFGNGPCDLRGEQEGGDQEAKDEKEQMYPEFHTRAR